MKFRYVRVLFCGFLPISGHIWMCEGLGISLPTHIG